MIDFRAQQMRRAKDEYDSALSNLADVRAKYRHLVGAQENVEAK
jgi:hypothetical protein